MGLECRLRANGVWLFSRDVRGCSQGVVDADVTSPASSIPSRSHLPPTFRRAKVMSRFSCGLDDYNFVKDPPTVDVRPHKVNMRKGLRGERTTTGCRCQTTRATLESARTAQRCRRAFVLVTWRRNENEVCKAASVVSTIRSQNALARHCPPQTACCNMLMSSTSPNSGSMGPNHQPPVVSIAAIQWIRGLLRQTSRLLSWVLLKPSAFVGGEEAARLCGMLAQGCAWWWIDCRRALMDS